MKKHSLPNYEGRDTPASGLVTPIMMDKREMFIEHAKSCIKRRTVIEVKCLVNKRGELVCVPICDECGICMFIDPSIDRGGVPAIIGVGVEVDNSTRNN